MQKHIAFVDCAPGVSKVPVTDAEGAAQLVLRAAANRAVDSTAMNSVSSRSHSVFMLYISGWHAGTGTRLQGCLCLVDLAGRCAHWALSNYSNAKLSWTSSLPWCCRAEILQRH